MSSLLPYQPQYSYMISNAIDLLCSGQVPKTGIERDDFELNFEEVPALFTSDEREEWLKKLGEVAVSSDAFFPFSDNVYRLARSGAKYAAAPTGSVNDNVSLVYPNLGFSS